MDIKALQLESRFSLPPNSLGYCGRAAAPAKFKKCIINGTCEEIPEEVKKFIVLYPYLRTIAKFTSLPIFSYRVIESYWLGNDELIKAKLADYDQLLNNFLKQGVPDFFVAELRLNKPKIFIPNHLFHVLHIGVGKASGAVPFNLDSINNCMIRWGKVEKTKNEKQKTKNKNIKLKISLNSLRQNENSYELFKKTEDVAFNNELLQGLKAGDYVAVHWNMIIKILTEDEIYKLDYWTKRVLENRFL